MIQPTLESWEEKARRLAQELKQMSPDPLKATTKQRADYRHKRYEMQLHLAAVPDD